MKAKFVIKGGPGSGNKGHAGIPGQVGGSAPSGSSDIPKLPPELRRGTTGEVMARQRERSKIMEEHYSVKFSDVSSNPLGVAEGKKLGAKGAGLPRAIYDGSVVTNTDKAIHSKILDAYKSTPKPPAGGYVTYTQLKLESNVTFQELFGAIKYWKSANPYAVTFTVDRLGKNTAVKLDMDKLL
jgi:hypothetical protein